MGAQNLLIKNLGLALGGGGARGIAHLGVLDHFEKIGLRFDSVAGTSAGAIAAALYASKIPLETMKSEFKTLKPAELTALKMGQLGLFENRSLREMLERLLPAEAKIEETALPLAIQCTDLLTGQAVILTKGPLIETVMASTCVPGVYLPVEREGRLLVDGGLTENVPLSGLEALGATMKVAVNLNGQQGYQMPKGVLEVITTAMDIAIDARTRDQLEAADLLISLDLTQFSRMNSQQFDELVERGRLEAEKAVNGSSDFFFQIRAGHLTRNLKESLPLKVPTKILRGYLKLKKKFSPEEKSTPSGPLEK